MSNSSNASFEEQLDEDLDQQLLNVTVIALETKPSVLRVQNSVFSEFSRTTFASGLRLFVTLMLCPGLDL